MKHKSLIITVVTLLFLALILANINVKEVVAGFAKIGFATIGLCLLIHFGVYFLRSMTLYLIVGNRKIFHVILNAHLIHNFYLNILPASMGELSLPILLKGFIGQTKTISALVITRLVMLVCMLGFFILSSLSVFTSSVLISVNYNKIGLLVIGILVCMVVIILLSRNRRIRKNKKIDYVFSKFIKLYEVTRDYIKEDFKPAKVAMLVLYTVAYLLMLALFYKVLMDKLELHFSMMQIFFIMSIQAAILILPIKSFAGFGTTEGSWMLGMMSLGLDHRTSLESGLIIHIVALFSSITFAVIGFALRSYIIRNVQNKVQVVEFEH